MIKKLIIALVGIYLECFIFSLKECNWFLVASAIAIPVVAISWIKELNDRGY